MASQDDFSYTIVLPRVNTIHESVIAFLQTVDQGAWSVDESKINNPFKLHFMRGNWGQSFFGLGSKRVPKAAWHEFEPRKKSMLLEVTLRPSPQDVRINLRYSVFYEYLLCPREAYLERWNSIICEEIDALREYSAKCYNLEEAPLRQAS